MLKLYNKEHVAISALTNLKDYKIEYLLSGEDLVEFSLSICDENINLVEEEGYVRSKNNEYVIKAIDPSDNFKRFSCNVNVESLVGKSIANFDTSNNNITDTIRLAIAGTGWILADNNITKRRTVRLKNTNALEVLREIREVFRVDFRFDAINKKIYVYEPFGEDRGVYFSDELNLRSLSIPSDTYEYATRLFAYGKDGLNISSINNGKEYVENYQYSNKIIELIWEDNRYTDINSLKADAEAKLEELSKPKRSYQADVSDLAKLNDEYSYLDFGIGDTITLLSKSEKFRDKQRIVKYIEYPNNPSMNTCELGNTTLTFEDLQKENENKNNTVDNITSDNGTVDGSKVDSITTEQISNFKASVAEITDLTVINADITNLKAQNVTITGELNAVKANIGTLTVNVATIDKLTVTHTANINELNSNKASITQLNAVSATINTLEVDVGKIQTLVNGNLSSENIQAGGITSDKLTIANGFITNAMIANLDVSKVNAGVISTEKFQIKSSDGSMEFIGSTQQFKDKNNKVRIQLGKDTQGNFNFIIRGEDGTTTLIDHTGVKANALADNLIVSNMIGIDAVGEKQINYSSFATGFNKDTNTSTIKSTKIMLNNQNQSLEVAFNSLKTQADGTKTTTESNSTTISVMQGQISTAINNTQIVKDGQTILLKDDYNRTVSIVNSMNSTIGSHTTKIDANTGKITGVETKTNELERTLNSVSSRLTSTETTVTTHTTNITKAQTDATKGINDAKIAKTQADKGVSDAKGALDKANLVDGKVTTLNTTVTTTNTKVSAIEQNLNSITQRVASTESTTTTLTTKVNTAQSTADSAKSTASSANSKIDGLEVGGRNLFVGNRFSVYANYNRLTAQDGSKEVISTWNDTYTGITFTLSNSGYTPKGTYTLSGFLKVNDSIPKTKYFTSRASTYGDNLQENFYDPKTGYFRIVQDYMGNSIWILHGPTTRTSGSSDMVVLSNLKFEKGNKATDWTPAPEDVQNQIDTHTTEITSTKSKVATVETNLTGITSRVGSVETKQTTTDGKVAALETWKKQAEVKITDASIISTVSSQFYKKSETDSKYATISQLTQTDDKFEFKFSQSGAYNHVYNGSPSPLNTVGWSLSNAQFYKNEAMLGIVPNDAYHGSVVSEVIDVSNEQKYSFKCILKCEGNIKGYTILVNGYLKHDDTDANWQQELKKTTVGSGVNEEINISFEIPAHIKYLRLVITHNGVKDFNLQGHRILFYDKVQIFNGENCFPKWSPCIDEINNASTVINSSGITVNNGKIKIKNQNGADVFWVDQKGKLSTDNVFIYGQDSTGNLDICGNGNKGIGLRSLNGRDRYIDFTTVPFDESFENSVATGKHVRIMAKDGKLLLLPTSGLEIGSVDANIKLDKVHMNTKQLEINGQIRGETLYSVGNTIIDGTMYTGTARVANIAHYDGNAGYTIYVHSQVQFNQGISYPNMVNKESQRLQDENISFTEDAVNCILMGGMSTYKRNGGVNSMASYLGNQIYKGKLEYDEVIVKYPDLKKDIDLFLEGKVKNDGLKFK